MSNSSKDFTAIQFMGSHGEAEVSVTLFAECMAICVEEGPVLITKQQAMDFFNLAEVSRNKLLDCLAEISSMCVGEVAMSHSLDAQCIGQMIYEATGMTQPELFKKVNSNREAACNRGES